MLHIYPQKAIQANTTASIVALQSLSLNPILQLLWQLMQYNIIPTAKPYVFHLPVS